MWHVCFVMMLSEEQFNSHPLQPYVQEAFGVQNHLDMIMLSSEENKQAISDGEASMPLIPVPVDADDYRPLLTNSAQDRQPQLYKPGRLPKTSAHVRRAVAQDIILLSVDSTPTSLDVIGRFMLKANVVDLLLSSCPSLNSSVDDQPRRSFSTVARTGQVFFFTFHDPLDK